MISLRENSSYIRIYPPNEIFMGWVSISFSFCCWFLFHNLDIERVYFLSFFLSHSYSLSISRTHTLKLLFFPCYFFFGFPTIFKCLLFNYELSSKVKHSTTVARIICVWLRVFSNFMCDIYLQKNNKKNTQTIFVLLMVFHLIYFTYVRLCVILSIDAIFSDIRLVYYDKVATSSQSQIVNEKKSKDVSIWQCHVNVYILCTLYISRYEFFNETHSFDWLTCTQFVCECVCVFIIPLWHSIQFIFTHLSHHYITILRNEWFYFFARVSFSKEYNI